VRAQRGLTLGGKVRDRLTTGTGAPIQGVRIQATFADREGVAVITDSNGTYRIEGLASKPFELTATKPGYESIARPIPALTGNTTLNLDLPPISGTLRGHVFDRDLDPRSYLGGAEVRVISGSNSGKRTVARYQGVFLLHDVWGDFDISVSYPGYESETAPVSIVGEELWSASH
jgi:hypothetical protein